LVAKSKLAENDEVTPIDPFGYDKKLLPTDTATTITNILSKH